MSAPRTDHYSYSVYADPAMAESFEGLRFSGPIGRLIAESQERVLAEFLAPVNGRTVLDVGTGTGRAAIALARRGATVTGVDASNEMLDVARVRAADAHVNVTFAHGRRPWSGVRESVVRRRGVSAGVDAHSRLAAIAGRAVPRRSHSRGLRLSGARKRGGDPSADAARCRRRWRARRGLPGLQRSRRAGDASRAAGSGVIGSDRQFVLPIALHKAVGSLAVTSRVEGALARLGLRSLLGSPVTVVAERCAS